MKRFIANIVIMRRYKIEVEATHLHEVRERALAKLLGDIPIRENTDIDIEEKP